MSATEPAPSKAAPAASKTAPAAVNKLIGLFVVIAFGAWTLFSVTDVTTEVWAWLIVAGVAMIAAVVTGAVAGPET